MKIKEKIVNFTGYPIISNKIFGGKCEIHAVCRRLFLYFPVKDVIIAIML